MDFVANTEKDRKEMLKVIGVDSVEDLLEVIPKSIREKARNREEPFLPEEGLSELELMRYFRNLSEKNADLNHYSSYLGAGAYEHFIPAVVNEIVSRSEFYTAYTPYQAEVSQGMLQSIFEFQSLVCELAAMDVANASIYDGASALAEAAILAVNETSRKKILVARSLHPEYREVLKTYLKGLNIQIEEIPFLEKQGMINIDHLKAAIDEKTAAVIIQNPNFLGIIETEVEEIERIVHSEGALLIASVNPISLGILKPPGEYNADIAVGEGQALGNPLYFGGPYLGFLAAKEKFVKRMPGRIVGETRDTKGGQAFVLAWQTREQHIRREKATSNICTNEALNALAASVYLSYLGPQGIQELANLNLQKSHYTQERILEIEGFESKFSGPFFNEFVIKPPLDPYPLNEKLLEYKIIGGLNLVTSYLDLIDCLLFCVTETKTKEEIDHLVDVLGVITSG